MGLPPLAPKASASTISPSRRMPGLEFDLSEDFAIPANLLSYFINILRVNTDQSVILPLSFSNVLGPMPLTC